MKRIKKNLKWISLIIIIILISSIIMVKYYLTNNNNIDEFTLNDKQNNEHLEIVEEQIQTDDENSQEEIKKIYVDIKGAINNPGVYEIEENKKVIDVVELAGGFTGQADTTMINLAKKVTDQMVIIIYTKEEVRQATETETVVKVIEKECICPEIKNDACIGDESSKPNETTSDSNETFNGKVNINTATIEELLTISGIGESKAKAIIDYRKENGNFKSIEDILNVSGIGETLYEKIKASITI